MDFDSLKARWAYFRLTGLVTLPRLERPRGDEDTLDERTSSLEKAGSSDLLTKWYLLRNRVGSLLATVALMNPALRDAFTIALPEFLANRTCSWVLTPLRSVSTSKK